MIIEFLKTFLSNINNKKKWLRTSYVVKIQRSLYNAYNPVVLSIVFLISLSINSLLTWRYMKMSKYSG